MNTLGSKTGTNTITASASKSRLDIVIEKVAAEKGLLNTFRNIATRFVLPAFKIFKLLLKYKGNEKSIFEKLLKRSNKLTQKLEKYNLTKQYNELIRDIQVTRPNIVVKILRRLGGDVEAARQYILSLTSLATSRALDERIVEQYPNFESIYESLLRKGISVPAALVLNLLLKFEGAIEKVEEALTSKNNFSIFSDLFNEGRTLIRSLKQNIFGGEESSNRTSSETPETSRVEVVKSEREVIEDEAYIQKLVQGNKFLISNGFTVAQENILTLKKFGGDTALALKYLVLRSIRGESEDITRNTNRNATTSNDIYNTAYGTSRYGRGNVNTEFSNSLNIPSERYHSSSSSINPTAYNTSIPMIETELTSLPYISRGGSSSRLGELSSRNDIASRIIPRIVSAAERVGSDRSSSSTLRNVIDLINEVEEIFETRSSEVSRNQLENILRRLMELITTLSNQDSSSNRSSASRGIGSGLESSILRDTRNSSSNSGYIDPDVEAIRNMIMESKRRM